MKATGLVLAVGALLMSLVACSTRAADEPDAAAEIAALRAENNMLKKQRTDLLERLKTLEQEISRLKALLKDAGIDAEQKAHAEQAPVEEKQVSPRAVVIADAIRRYQQEAGAAFASDDTAIQKMTAWLQAARRLNEVLGQGTILIEYEVADVEFEADTNTALLMFSSAKVGDFEPEPLRMRISSDERTALSIKKGSRVTLQGVASLNIDFSQPASKQPVRTQDSEQSHWVMAFIYIPRAVEDQRLPHGPKVELLVTRNCIIEVDGVRRVLRGFVG